MNDKIKKAAKRQEQKMRERIKSIKISLPEPEEPQCEEKDFHELEQERKQAKIAQIKAKFGGVKPDKIAQIKARFGEVNDNKG